jgi:hypothetical protein
VTQGTTEHAEAKRAGLSAMAPFVQRYRTILVVVLLALIACAITAQSAWKLFWWDELASYDVAQLPHASDVWSFYRAGLDTPSPACALIVQRTLHWIGQSEVLARIPFEAAFLAMCLCLYGITARRYGAGYALSALLLPAISGTFYFASEMHAYALVLGAVSFALYCWQGIPQRGLFRLLGIPGVFLGLAIAILCHVFSLFVVIPFALAQLVRDWRARRIDVPVWAALILAPVCLLIELPGMQAAHKAYASVFWSKPDVSQILWSFSYCIQIGWMISVILVLMFCTAWRDNYSEFKSLNHDRGFDSAEWMLIAALALQPFYAWPLSHLVGVYVPRYVLSLTIGIALLIVAGTAETLKRNRLAGVALGLAFLIAFMQDKHRMVARAVHAHETSGVALQQQPWIQTLQKSSLPVIAPNTTVYISLQHYVSPELERRLYYTSNTPPAIRLDEGADNQLAMRQFATRIPLRVQDFSTFISQHPSFLIVVEAPLAPVADTGNLSVHLIANYKAEERFGFSYFSVYQVDVVNNPQHGGDHPASPSGAGM